MSDFWTLVDEKKKKKQTLTPTTEKTTTSTRGGSSTSVDFWSLVDESKKKKEEEDIAPIKSEETVSRTWFQKGALDEGVSVKSVAKAILGTGQDVTENFYTGILGMGEQAVDTGAYLFGLGAGIVGADQLKKKTGEFIAKDLYDEKKVAQDLTKLTVANLLGGSDNSVLGEKSDSLVQSGGQLAAQVGLQQLGVPWYVTSGITSFGGETENALRSGATYERAGLSAAIDAGAEILSEKLFGGSALGERGLINVEKLTKGIADKAVKALADYGIDVLTEAGEEVFSQLMSNLASKLYREESLRDIMHSEEAVDGYIEAAIGGGLLSGTTNFSNMVSSARTKTDYRTGLNTNEEAVIKKEVENRIEEKKKAGEKVTKKDVAKIEDAVMTALDKGYISTDLIEEVLGGESYKAYADTVANENAQIKQLEDNLKELGNSPNTVGYAKAFEAVENQLKELKGKSQKESLKKTLSDEVSNLVKDSRLAESYAEKERAYQKLDISTETFSDAKYADAAKQTVASAIELGANNTNRVKDLVENSARIAGKTGKAFIFKDGEAVKNSFIERQTKKIQEYENMDNLSAKQQKALAKMKQKLEDVKSGKIIVNGEYSADGIVLNIDSKNPLMVTVGHEVTHGTENTKSYGKMKKALFAYAKTKGVDVDTLIEMSKMTYDGIADAVAEQEVVADLVGEMLFTDDAFVEHLARTDTNVFQNLWNDIKNLVKMATPGSKEAKELANLEHKFEKAFREANKAKHQAETGTQYKVSGNPDFNSEEWSIVNRRKYSEFYNPKYVLDEDHNWMYANEKGYTVFAIYSKNDPGDPTVLYGSSGKKAIRDYGKLNRFFEEGQRYAGNNRATFDRILNDIKSSQRNTSNGISFVGEQGTTAGNVYFPFGESGSNRQRNFEDSTTDFQESKLIQNTDEASEDSGASITFSNDYQEWRNRMKEGDTGEDDIRYSLSSAESNAPKTYAEITQEQQNLLKRERDLEQRKREATNNPELLQAMDDYSALFEEMRTLLPKRKQGTATQAELDRIEEIKALREERMMRVAELQESLGLKAISDEEAEIREMKENLRKAADEAWEREGAEKENLAIEKAGIPAAEYFRKKALKAFKTTTNFNEAGYMLPDGKLLNFSGGERNHRYRDHREIGEIYEATNGTAALNRFLNDGNIRIMAESPGIDLASGVEPTREQYAALRKFINTNGVADGQFFVDFSGTGGEVAGKYQYTGKVLADRIINDIKYFYEHGKVREDSGLLGFLSISPSDAQPTANGLTGKDFRVQQRVDDIAPVAQNAVQNTKTTFDAPVRNDVTQAEEERVADILTEEPAVEKKNGVMGWVRNNILDKGMVFEKLSKKTKNRELEAKWNSIRYSNGKAQHLIGEGAKGVKSLNAIREQVEKTGKTKDFYEYLYHRHNVDRMSLEDKYQDVKNKPVFGNSVTADDSRARVKMLEMANPKFKDFAQDVYNYMNHLRKEMVDNGVISQELADKWAEMYPNYVPIRRSGDFGLAINVPLDSRRTGVNVPVKKATGGSSDILPLFDTMGQRTMQTYKAIAKNRFGIELKNTLGTTLAQETTNVDDVLDNVDAPEELLQGGKRGKNPTFTVFENGEKVTFEITDEMYDAMKPTSDILSYTNKVTNTVSSIFRGLTTEYNPTFMLTNPIKDFQDVLLNSQHPAKTYGTILEAIRQMRDNGKWYQEYVANGGEQNSYFDSSSNTFVAEKKIPGLYQISRANNYIEMTPRLAEYIASRKAGRSIDVSMLDAARVTTNFAAGGDVTKFLNRNGATFLNASVQGAIQNVRNFQEAKMNGLKGVMGLAAKFAVAGLPLLLLNNLFWEDDEEYEELSEYVKQNYYLVWKFDDGQFLRVPKGRGVAVIQEAFNQMENLITGDDEADMKSFLDLLVSNLAPNNPLDNNIIAPILQVKNNKTWYGEDLVPTRLQDVPAAEQYDESTDVISRWLGEKLNVSPYKINYLLNQYSGGLGDMFLPMLTPEAESGDNTFVGNLMAPLKSKFTTDSVMNNQNVTDFYDMKDELAVNANASTATDDDKLKYKYMSSVGSEVSELYKQKRKIQNGNLPDDKKYEQVRNIQKQINELMEEGLANYQTVTYKDEYAFVGDRMYKRDDDGEWQKMSDEQIAKYKAISSAGGSNIATDGTDYWQRGDDGEWNKMDKSQVAKHKAIAEAGDSIYATDGESHWVYHEDGEESEWRKLTDEQVNKQNAYTRALNVSAEDYWKYENDISNFDAKDENGNSVNGLKKQRVYNYIFNELDIDYGAKCILYRSVYDSKSDIAKYNYDIVEYLDSRDDLSWEDMKNILIKLDFKVSDDGRVTW